jgi:signal transduction histidine kinase
MSKFEPSNESPKRPNATCSPYSLNYVQPASICTSYQDRLGIAVDADLTAVTVSEPVGHALLRVTQEACTNAVRHGHASQLRVSLARQNGDIELAIRDNGTGFDPGVSHAGSGLHHIRDRVTELGGTVKIESTPGSGAVVTVRVPAP